MLQGKHVPHPPTSPPEETARSPRIARLSALPQPQQRGEAVNLPSPQPASLQEPPCRHRELWEASKAAGAGSAATSASGLAVEPPVLPSGHAEPSCPAVGRGAGEAAPQPEVLQGSFAG